MNKFKVMQNRKSFYTLSVILIVLSVVLLLVKGFKYGIDFKGGNVIHVTFNDQADENKIRNVFSEMKKEINVNGSEEFYFDVNAMVIQATGDISSQKEFNISYPNPDITLKSSAIHDKILEKLMEKMPYDISTREVSNVGATIGDEMKTQGIISAILSVIGILLYLGFRFDFYSATGVVIAVVHDLLITLGFISLMAIEFDTTVLAAVLTLLGYSVNDSIVIFDRIRENKRISKETTYSGIVNESINQSLTRTVNTTITTLIALFALVLLGGDAIYSFSIVLTVGCIVGTYSSLTISAPVVVDITNDKKTSDYTK